MGDIVKCKWCSEPFQRPAGQKRGPFTCSPQCEAEILDDIQSQYRHEAYIASCEADRSWDDE